MTAVTTPLKPRKSPVQARSAATLDALHTAVVQVLVAEGLSACTTTRLAARAGVSVGSLYQYYPNRDALLAAVLERHLDGVARAVEQTCRAHRGRPLADMAAALVTAFLAVKLRAPEESKALYAIAGERDGAALASRMHDRVAAAVADLLNSAPDARFDDPLSVATITMGALIGPVRTALEGRSPPGLETGLKDQLIRLVTGYLETYRVPGVNPRA